MTFATVFQAVREKFRDDVAVPNGLVVVHDNALPNDLSQSWYRFEVNVDNTKQVYSGNSGDRRVRATGKAILRLYCPVAKGDGAMLAICDAVVTAFFAASVASPIVKFQEPTLVGPPGRDDAWFVRVMHLPFFADMFL